MSNAELIARLRYQHLPDSPWDQCDLVEVMEAAADALEAAESSTIVEWADYFERFDSTVGAPTLTPALVASLMRGPRPFGCVSGVQS